MNSDKLSYSLYRRGYFFFDKILYIAKINMIRNIIYHFLKQLQYFFYLFINNY